MSSPQHEPTMEEILASIRKIISEDAPADAPANVEAPAPEQPVYHAEPEVLELTQEVAPPPPAPAPMPEPEPYHAPVDDIVFQTETPAPEPAPAPTPAPSNDIFSDHTRNAMDKAFAIPDEEPEAAPAPRPVAAIRPVDGSSVETVFERAVRESFEPVLQKYLSDNSSSVIEGMKPVIREWMDEHFPALLEGAVRSEVERVVKARGAKR